MSNHLPEVTALIRRQLKAYRTGLFECELDGLAEHIAGNLLTVYRVEPKLLQEKAEEASHDALVAALRAARRFINPLGGDFSKDALVETINAALAAAEEA